MKTGKLILIVAALICSKFFAAPFDTGYITWTQPNGVTFIARSWGDEFENWMETDNGYRIINGPNQYFYYAVLDERGEFYPSSFKVGIDNPLSTSYLLERTQDRIQQIEQDRIDFSVQLQTNFNNYINDQRFNGSTPQPMKVAIVLVDFTPSERDGNYTKAEFDTLFFSTDYYISPSSTRNPRSPDLEQVFGSFKDYFLDQSLGRLDIRGKINDDRSIMNPPDPNNPTKPQWVIMPYSKSYYDSIPRAQVVPLVVAQVNAQLPFDFNDYYAIGLIYAGDGANILGGTSAFGGMGKLFGAYEKYHNTFAHIGIPAHEFAHNLGAADEYLGILSPFYWDLMALGCYNGPDYYGTNTKRGSCPAPFDPAYRIKFNWIAPQLILEPVNDKIVEYSSTCPIFYKVKIPGSDEYFIIERRKKNGFDLYTPSYENGLSNPPPGILIWHIAPQKYGSFDLVEVEHANNIPNSYTNNRFPSPVNSVQDFTDFTSPSSNQRNGDNSLISIKNIEWIGNLETGYAKLDYNIEALEITGTQTWSTNMNLALPVFIKDGGTLNITNGADVHLNGDNVEQVKLVVEDGGTLNLTGSENNRVVLLSGDFESPIRKWGGIKIIGTGILESNFAVIQDALKPITVLEDYASCSLNNTLIIGNPEIVDNKVQLSGNIAIENSTFEKVPISIFKSNPGSHITKSTLFTDNLYHKGITLKFPAESFLSVTNCTINGFHLGLLFGEETQPPYWDRTTQIVVMNNIITNCERSIDVQLGDITINYNNFYDNGEDNFPGTNYLTANPSYVNPVSNDFNLQWESGCIDAGNPAAIYNDPDGTRNDMGAKYYDQTPFVPANFTVTLGPDDHPLLQWEGALHLHYKVYALYEYFSGSSANNEYSTLTDSYIDETVVFTEPTGEDPNQYAIYSVTSINSIDEESQNTEEITIDAYGRLPKKSFIDSSFIPVSYNLFNPFPNPFNPSTKIAFDLPENSPVTLKVYNVTGEEIKTLVNNTLTAGRHQVVFEGNGLPSGIYFVRIVTKDYLYTKKLILMK